MTAAAEKADDAAADHDLLLVRGAIGLVSSGGARRVTVIARHSNENVVAAAQAFARKNGVIVRAIWRPAGDGCDIAVEPVA